jgi:preprotein translocase subunit YajC
MGVIHLPALFGAMWFFTIRPQQQRLRNQRALVSSLSPGDQVVTAGGIIGTITAIGDGELSLDVGAATVRLLPGAVTARYDAGPTD